MTRRIKSTQERLADAQRTAFAGHRRGASRVASPVGNRATRVATDGGRATPAPNGRFVALEGGAQDLDGTITFDTLIDQAGHDGLAGQLPITTIPVAAAGTYDLEIVDVEFAADAAFVADATIDIRVDGTSRHPTPMSGPINEDGFDRAFRIGPLTAGASVEVRITAPGAPPITRIWVTMQLIEPTVGRLQPRPLDGPAGYIGAVADEDTASESTASVSLAPHASTAEGDIVLIAVNTSKTATGSYGTFTPDPTPAELHRFPFSDFIDGVEAAVYWWRSDGTLPMFTYELTGTGVQHVVVTMITYPAENFPASGDPFVGVAHDWGTSNTDTRSIRAASDPGGDWVCAVTMGVRNTTTTGTGTDYEQLWDTPMMHNIEESLRGSTAGDYINSPESGSRRGGYHTQGATDGGISATFGEEYTHQWVVAAGVGFQP